MRFSSCLFVPLLSVLACDPSPSSSAEPLGSVQIPIINGELDSAHSAAVAVVGRQSLCTGTIIAVNPAVRVGYVLTAAHCVDRKSPPLEVRQGTWLDSPSLVYRVLDYEPHPAYDEEGQGFDFAMIKIAGVSANTPVIPAMTPAEDDLRSGDPIVSVGFGRTELEGAPGGDDGQRRSFSTTIESLEAGWVKYSLRSGGMCKGDSGGPVVHNTSSGKRTVAVHSFVSPDCSGDGYSGRVSEVYNSFIKPYMDGVTEPNCELCLETVQSGDGACVPSIDDCINDADCKALMECLNACEPDSTGCTDQCAETHRGALDTYMGIYECFCEVGCPEICAEEPMCQKPPCGFTFQDDACSSCNEAKCCDSASQCADDADCAACAQSGGLGCATNQLWQGFVGCLGQNCSEECGVTPPSNGGGGTGGGSGGAGGTDEGGGGGTDEGGEAGGAPGDASSETPEGNEDGNGSGEEAPGTLDEDNIQEVSLEQPAGCACKVTPGATPGASAGAGAFALLLIGLLRLRRQKASTTQG